MILVSDASPIHYLILIQAIDLLPRLYGHVLVPAAVVRELLDEDTPRTVRQWITTLPTWLEVCTVTSKEHYPLLDMGEREAVILALERGAELLLIDERAGRRVAQAEGLTVTGTLGVLEAGALRGLIALEPLIARLMATNFRASRSLVATLLERDRQR